MEYDLPKLITAEEIYDLDAITLQEKIDEMKKSLPRV